MTKDAEDQCVDPGLLRHSLGFLTRATHQQERDFIRPDEQLVLGFARYSALAVISENPGARLRDIAWLLQIKESNLVPLVADLEGKGLLCRSRRKERRGIGHDLTDEGRAVFARVEPIMKDYDRRFAEVLDDREYSQLTGLLTKVFMSRLSERPAS